MTGESSAMGHVPSVLMPLTIKFSQLSHTKDEGTSPLKPKSSNEQSEQSLIDL